MWGGGGGEGDGGGAHLAELEGVDGEDGGTHHRRQAVQLDLLEQQLRGGTASRGALSLCQDGASPGPMSTTTAMPCALSSAYVTAGTPYVHAWGMRVRTAMAAMVIW